MAVYTGLCVRIVLDICRQSMNILAEWWREQHFSEVCTKAEAGERGGIWPQRTCFNIRAISDRASGATLITATSRIYTERPNASATLPTNIYGVLRKCLSGTCLYVVCYIVIAECTKYIDRVSEKGTRRSNAGRSTKGDKKKMKPPPTEKDIQCSVQTIRNVIAKYKYIYIHIQHFEVFSGKQGCADRHPHLVDVCCASCRMEICVSCDSCRLQPRSGMTCNAKLRLNACKKFRIRNSIIAVCVIYIIRTQCLTCLERSPIPTCLVRGNPIHHEKFNSLVRLNILARH